MRVIHSQQTSELRQPDTAEEEHTQFIPGTTFRLDTQVHVISRAIVLPKILQSGINKKDFFFRLMF